MQEHTILYLNGAQVAELGAGDMPRALEDVEETFRLVYRGDAIVPEKTAMGFGKDFLEEAEKGRINAMPGFLGGRFQMAGIKWIGSNPKNLLRGLPRASCVTILNDPDTKFPVCVMNGSQISAMRTGASSGVAAKYLARKEARTLMLVGAGYQNRTQLEAIYCTCPQLEHFYVVDIVEEAAMRFAKERGAKVYAITDSQLSPLAETADITLFARSDMVSFADSLVAPMALINAVIVALNV